MARGLEDAMQGNVPNTIPKRQRMSTTTELLAQVFKAEQDLLWLRKITMKNMWLSSDPESLVIFEITLAG